ncbi:CDP-alcohol phosphatidyltransferase family protein [Vulgatibacter sp.]|uniref:CDP-alcohol phosphatidyltransferase family protein n=1 Tax=Vulgatibacter sp. TaxID=1971226 RepID=UPI00356AABAC
MNLPNAISLVRLLLVPVFAWLHLRGEPLAALVVFVAAAISDGIDGFLARALDQRTALGAILDPIADKLLGLTALVLLVWSAVLPVWFLGVSLLRDAVVAAVGITSKASHRSVRAAPTRISKYATFLLMATVTLALFSRSPDYGAAVVPYLAAVGAVAAECLLVATVQYGMLWWSVLRGRRLDTP